LSPACPRLDVTIDGADEVDDALDCIKGGGGCQTLEKIVAAAAGTFVLVTDFSKRSPQLLTTWRKGVPVEVLPAALTPVDAALRRLGGAPALRMGAPAKAGPAVTDNGNFLLDVDFEGGRGLAPGQAARLHAEVKALPGVVETGFFCGMAEACFFGEADGTASVVRRKP
jgi:ribose 5-phosphate isomerase A